MEDGIARFVARIRELEDELEQEVRRRREQFKYRIEGKRITFEDAPRARHRKLKRGILQFLRESGFMEVITSPFIYSLIVPLALLERFPIIRGHIRRRRSSFGTR